MAKPRVFVSSTYFDLRVVRANIERFIKEIGYDAVLFEKGHIAYGKDNALEDYCYREISTCDILVAIIGGKYGTQARQDTNSVTQKEIKTAIELGKQVYFFVEKSVYSEYNTYLVNKQNESFIPASVNDKRIFHFLEEVYSLQSGNPVEPFETSEDITRFLKEQWAGLFQRLLQESSRVLEIDIIKDLKSTADTLNQMVTFLTEQQKSGDGAIKEILLSTHPAFTEIKKLAHIPYRIIFHNLEELKELLVARQYIFDDTFSSEGFYDFDSRKLKEYIRIDKNIFDEENNLKIITPQLWNKDYIKKLKLGHLSDDLDSDIPF